MTPSLASRPSPETGLRDLGRIARTLSRTYGDPRLGNKDDPLDEAIYIILSGKTTSASFARTYEALSVAFPNWWGILSSPRGRVAKIIKEGGLSKKKEAQIRALLGKLRAEGGISAFNALKETETAEAERFLSSLPGIGLKSARCILMYSLGRAVFPVDTHCRRILSRLGVVRFRRLTDTVQDEIQAAIPPDLRYSLHVNLVAHGRAVCKPRSPECQACVVSSYCDYYSRTTA